MFVLLTLVVVYIILWRCPELRGEVAACLSGSVPKLGVADIRGDVEKVLRVYSCNTRDQMRRDLFTACWGHYVSLCGGQA
jgi:hypothetical protein